MPKAIRIFVAVILSLLAFLGALVLFLYTVFRFNHGYVRLNVFLIVAAVLFVCTTFIVNVVWQAICARFFTRASR